MDGHVEKEMCNNCKKEIPHTNYVMHTMHCARNITLCKVCNEPIPKLEYETHRERCKPIVKKPTLPPSNLEKSSYFQQRKAVEDKKAEVRRETYLKKHEHLVESGFSLRESVKSEPINKVVEKSQKNQSGAIKKAPLIPRLDDGCTSAASSKGLLPCRYCDLELPKLDLEEHENYCGTRTDKCLECGELVMFKNKQVHLDSNHGFVKLQDEPGPRPTWDSSTQRSSDTDLTPSRRRFDRLNLSAIDYDPMPYLPAAYQPGGGLSRKKKEGESYKEISRRLDCKTEYIRNLLHDSASITIPLRSTGTAPRNHFNHNKGPAPQPPRRRNPPTELTIPCEFCDTPIPHEELIMHETGCRPDLARFNPRRNRAPLPDEDDYTPYVPYEVPARARTPPRADSPDSEELPCEFCSHMVPASQLWRHQLSCTSAA